MSSTSCSSSPERAAVRGRPRAWRTSSRATAAVLGAAAIACLFGPAAAQAHLRSGAVAVDYAASVRQPDTLAYAARIYQSDRGLSLTVKPGHVVVMLGYRGEPVFRLDAHGLWVNAASPTAVVSGLLTKAQRIPAPTPRWRLQRARRSAVWHDGRVQGLSPGVMRGAWSVPLSVDGRRVQLQGELRRFPAPSLVLWLGLLVCLLAAGACPLLTRREDYVRGAAIGFAVAAAASSVVVALAFALDAYASPGTWIEGLDGIAFLAVGLGVLFGGHENLRLGAAIGLGLVALAVGLVNGAVFLHPIVLAVLPGTITRLAVLVALGAGASALGLGLVFYAQTASPGRGSEWGAAPPLRDDRVGPRREDPLPGGRPGGIVAGP